MTEKQLKRAMEIKRELDDVQRIIKILSGGYKQTRLQIELDFLSATINYETGNISKRATQQIHELIMADARERKEQLKKEFEAL